MYKMVLNKIRNLVFNLGLEEVSTRKVRRISIAGHTDIIPHTTIIPVKYTEQAHCLWLWMTRDY